MDRRHEQHGGIVYRSWSSCDDCGFQGLVEYHCRGDEDYADETALGYMMDTHCPSCGAIGAVLVVVDEYREMVFMAANRRGAGPEPER